MQKTLALFDDGWHDGPLFEIRKRRMPKRYGTVLQGVLRRGTERRATPPWADRKLIAAVYRLARVSTEKTGVQHSVDHIVPLTHPIVCGLHVEWNLEVKPLAVNLRKSNLHWPDMPFEQKELDL